MTKAQALRLGRRLARRDGLATLTKEKFCKEAGISAGSLHHLTGLHFHEIVTDAFQNVGMGRNTDNGRARLMPNLRRDQLIRTAVDLARSHGFVNLTRQQVAEAANTSPALVSHYFDGMHGLTFAMMQHAVATENLTVLAQGIAANHPVAMKAPASLRRRALASQL